MRGDFSVAGSYSSADVEWETLNTSPNLFEPGEEPQDRSLMEDLVEVRAPL